MWLVALLVMTFLVFTRMQDAPYFQYKEMGMDIDPDALPLACGEELVPTGKAMDSIRKAGADWRTWVLTYFYFIFFGGFIALTVRFPTFWTGLFKISMVQAGLFTAAFSLSASLCGLPAASLRTNWAGLCGLNFPSWWWRPARWC